MDLANFSIQLLNGVQYGLLLFMLAAGLTLIFGIMGVVNLAHGSFYMLGAYLAWSLASLTGSFTVAVLGGALLSATSTSPLGSASSQRGCSSPRARADTLKPAGATGAAPCGQPSAGAILTVGTSVLTGGGSVGSGPSSAPAGSRAVSLQAASSMQKRAGRSRETMALEVWERPVAASVGGNRENGAWTNMSKMAA